MYYIQEKLTTPLRAKTLIGKNILIVEEDYVNFLLLKDIFSSTGCQVIRTINIDVAVEYVLMKNNVDLIIVNNSLTCGTQSEIVHYLKKEYSVPVVVMIEESAGGSSRFQKVVEWVDCAVSIDSDSDSLIEIFSELTNRHNV